MTVSNQSMSLLGSVLNAQTTRTQIGVAVLKKAQDVEKQEGAALVDMLEQAGQQAPESSKAPLLDVYA